MGNNQPKKRKKTTQHQRSRHPPLSLSRTRWPLSWAESLFLPEFPVRGKSHEQRFERLSEICKGSFGSVHLARDRATGKQCALKVLSKARVVKERAVQQCKDEVAIQAKLGDHPFIVPCTDRWQSKKHLFLVTPYLPHGDLHGIWKAFGPFSERLVRVLVTELALVIDFLHNVGVIYRDLKMENILLDNEGHVQLIDFGLARWLGYYARTSTICGTMQLMAPEILSMQPYGHAADWWSLGIIMYALLVGQYPVEGCDNHVAMQQRVAELCFDLPARFSEPARQAVRKLLCKQPHRRLSSLEQLKHESFFREVNFEELRQKKISPRKMLQDEMDRRAKPPSCPVADVLSTQRLW